MSSCWEKFLWWVVVVAQQNRVTPSPFNFGLKTLDLDLDLDCDNLTKQWHKLTNTSNSCNFSVDSTKLVTIFIRDESSEQNQLVKQMPLVEQKTAGGRDLLVFIISAASVRSSSATCHSFSPRHQSMILQTDVSQTQSATTFELILIF